MQSKFLTSSVAGLILRSCAVEQEVIPSISQGLGRLRQERLCVVLLPAPVLFKRMMRVVTGRRTSLFSDVIFIILKCENR